MHEVARYYVITTANIRDVGICPNVYHSPLRNITMNAANVTSDNSNRDKNVLQPTNRQQTTDSQRSGGAAFPYTLSRTITLR